MNLQQLEYILAVDELRHFAKAAESCRITQPTLSMMIHKLEEELEVKIFDRSTQPIKPTAVGKRIIDQARLVLRQATRLKEIVKEEKNILSGTFVIAVLPTIAPYLLPRFFPQLQKKYPELDIRISELKTNDCIGNLLSGKADAAIVANPPELSGLKEEILYYEQFFGYVSPQEPVFKKEIIRSSDIDGERLWLLDEGHCFRDQLMRFCQMENVKIRQQTYRLGSLETYMRMVEGGNGITFIPELTTLQLSDEQQKLVRPFAIPRPTRQIRLVTRTDMVRESILSLIKESVRESVPRQMITAGNKLLIL